MRVLAARQQPARGARAAAATDAVKPMAQTRRVEPGRVASDEQACDPFAIISALSRLMPIRRSLLAPRQGASMSPLAAQPITST
jgi:hypothetical protein